METPKGWRNGGDFYVRSDSFSLEVDFGDDEDVAVSLRFEWVRSFRFVSEASYNHERDGIEDDCPLLSERMLPDPANPSNDYYGDRPEAGKGPPKLFRVYHYKAGLIEVVASDWRHIENTAAPTGAERIE